MYHIERFTKNVKDSLGDVNNAQTVRIFQQSNKLIDIDDWRDWEGISFWMELVKWCESNFTKVCDLSLCSIDWKIIKIGNNLRFELRNSSDEQMITLYFNAEEFKDAVLEAI